MHESQANTSAAATRRNVAKTPSKAPPTKQIGKGETAVGHARTPSPILPLHRPRWFYLFRSMNKSLSSGQLLSH